MDEEPGKATQTSSMVPTTANPPARLEDVPEEQLRGFVEDYRRLSRWGIVAAIGALIGALAALTLSGADSAFVFWLVGVALGTVANRTALHMAMRNNGLARQLKPAIDERLKSSPLQRYRETFRQLRHGREDDTPKSAEDQVRALLGQRAGDGNAAS